jgi:N4-gp56 family major capsid protein
MWSAVNTVFTAAVQRTVTRTLKRQLAKPITSVVRASVNYGTDPIAPAFIGLCHPDLEYNLRKASGFVPIEKYASGGFMDGEIGKISDVRYILSTIVEPFRGAGASGGSNVIETGGVADVYPIIYLAKDAYGLVPLKGGNSIVPMIVNAKPSDSDPMAQRNHAAWKAMQTTIILNDFWMARAEVACTADGYLTD